MFHANVSCSGHFAPSIAWLLLLLVIPCRFHFSKRAENSWDCWLGLCRPSDFVPSPSSWRLTRFQTTVPVYPRITPLRLFQRIPQNVEVLQGEAGADGNGGEGVVGDVAGDAGDFGEQVVEVTQQRAAAGEDHALVNDVGR